mgnify:CR=1 FL=1
MNVVVTTVMRLLIAAVAVMALASGAASARPDPCLSLSSIVAGYSNTSTDHGRTAAEVFASFGKLTLFAKLGQAAAHVQDHEPVGTAINVVSPNADAAYAELSDNIRWFDAADLNPYSGVTLSPELAADPVFCTRGLLGGIYARGNSAVLIGRVADALFVAFRATNDGWSLTETPVTPDALDWTHQTRHYNRYEYVLPALMAYVADHPEIAHIYVAGDSLGAAMAQKFMLAHGGDGRFEARLFGSPGNPQIARQDHRIWTFIDDNDPIVLVPALKYKLSGKRFLIHIGRVPDVPPRGIFHNPQAYVRMMELLDDHDRGEAYLSYWEKGLGISWDGSNVPEWRKQLDLVARPATRVVAELGVYYTLSGNEDEEPVADAGAAEEFETPTPPAWRSKRQQKRTVQGRFLGCLLGGAVGDALGAPVEFMKRTEILRRFGQKGITQYAPAYGGLGTITDDTQMTLFTAEGLIRGWVRGCFKGITTYSGVTAHAYLRWLQTQGERPTCDIDFGTDEPGWLFQQRQLHSRRAPGNTCLSALRAMHSLGEPARNDSKGCGGVMRVAPVGLFAWRMRQYESTALDLATEAAVVVLQMPFIVIVKTIPKLGKGMVRRVALNFLGRQLDCHFRSTRRVFPDQSSSKKRTLTPSTYLTVSIESKSPADCIDPGKQIYRLKARKPSVNSA